VLKNWIKPTFSGFYTRLAKLTDYCLFYCLLAFTISCLPYFLSLYFYLGLILTIPVLWVPIEALLVSRYATTPGLALFRAKVHTEIGGHLTYGEAFRRALSIKKRSGVVFQKGMSFKRKLIAFIISAATIFAAIFGKPLTYYTMGLDTKIRNSEGWVQYYSMTRGFTVNFPDQPQEEVKQLEIPDSGKVLDYQEVSIQPKKDVLYSVSYMELPSKWRWAGSNTLLKGALDLYVKYNPIVSEVLNREIFLYQNHRALDFHLKQGDNEVQGRFVLVDNTLYKLTVVYPSSLREDVKEGQPFLDSFDLHPKGIS
jgi:hypothetical protein